MTAPVVGDRVTIDAIKRPPFRLSGDGREP